MLLARLMLDKPDEPDTPGKAGALGKPDAFSEPDTPDKFDVPDPPKLIRLTRPSRVYPAWRQPARFRPATGEPDGKGLYGEPALP